MLHLSFIKENKDLVILGLLKKHYKNADEDVNNIISTDQKKREIQTKLENTTSNINKINKEIGHLIKIGDTSSQIIDELKERKIQMMKITEELNDTLINLEIEIKDLLIKLPNVPHIAVPEGKTATDNLIIYTSGKIPELHEKALPHWELIKKYDIIDFELGNKITGAGFPVYKNKGAKLQRALINFFLTEASNVGYIEIQPPILVNYDSVFGTGQLPDKEAQMYYVGADELYLIPTGEVPITNLYRDMIIKESDLPIKNVGYTPCFRREAGSYGADVRGLNRLHQFDKVELVQICKAEDSYKNLGDMVDYVKTLLEKLELPFRIVKLCAGDMSFNSALTFDFEVYSAAQKKWLEVSSVSNFEAFQANRLKLRYKSEGKTKLLHTLNGSALALPRIVASILENYQYEDDIKIPEVLKSYTGFNLIENIK